MLSRNTSAAARRLPSGVEVAFADLFVLVLGLIVLAIAEVFAAGTRLDEDQALTV